jgi:hypothetical protein
MRKKVTKQLWKLASLVAQKSNLVRLPDGSVRWEGFARAYKDMKKVYKAGKGVE